MSVGYGFVCATCDRLTRPLAEGSHLEGCEAARARVRCGGPIVGMSFPAYEGALTKPAMAMHCFACGTNANKVLQAADGGYVGCCNEHMDMVTVIEQNDSVKALTPVEDTQDPDVEVA
jgi:hypothetical protein